ncbi:hypothetical protein JG687_00011023 [Phytophthora cactorum]|uniref:Uncharacterized protein n=1 Tax=Phytophthora cactorum TaxID=29920 RepID=A0A8T1U8A7_9STRA|nr:hypothetical protein JG687_00011023 [Phytophthora cactorum]
MVWQGNVDYTPLSSPVGCRYNLRACTLCRQHISTISTARRAQVWINGSAGRRHLDTSRPCSTSGLGIAETKPSRSRLEYITWAKNFRW